MHSTAYKEELITCPYDSAHRILKHRFSTHLVKCRRNNIDKPTVECKFNSSHVIPAPELRYHMDTCPDRKQMDDFIHVVDNARNFEINLDNDPTNDNDEQWEDDEVASYDPQEYCTSNQILRRLDTESKATRKKFRASERLRFQELEECKKEEGPGYSNRVPKQPAQSSFIPTQKLPEVLVSHLKELTITENSRSEHAPPPISEILNLASNRPGLNERAEELPWVQIPLRGRGRTKRN